MLFQHAKHNAPSLQQASVRLCQVELRTIALCASCCQGKACIMLCAADPRLDAWPQLWHWQLQHNLVIAAHCGCKTHACMVWAWPRRPWSHGARISHLLNIITFVHCGKAHASMQARKPSSQGVGISYLPDIIALHATQEALFTRRWHQSCA